jgi:NAD(P)-dependent dehydrogenase (short-subunit alcohol dehydrogenase family)
VIGVDRPGTDVAVVGDLAVPAERRRAVDEATALADGTLAAVVTCAGLAGSPDRKGSLLSSVNYFGTVEMLEGLRPLLVPGGAAVAISSNSTTVQPDIPLALVEACLDGDEERAAVIADEDSSIAAYAASKIAVAHWVRAHATGPEWAGAGLRLNAVAPGMIETPMVAAMRADETTGPMLDLLPIPVGRPGRPEEIAALIEFLLGPDAALFCGSIVFCDGGSDALLRTRDWPAAWDISVRDFTRHAT